VVGFSSDAVSFGCPWWSPVGWVEQQTLGVAGGRPAAFMRQMMMKTAEQNEVATVGTTFTAPVD
jgi:hypothetical protein